MNTGFTVTFFAAATRKQHRRQQSRSRLVSVKMQLTEIINDAANFHQLARANVWAVGEAEVQEDVLAVEVRVRGRPAVHIHKRPRAAQGGLAHRLHLPRDCQMKTRTHSTP
jgi:hypothetical protein